MTEPSSPTSPDREEKGAKGSAFAILIAAGILISRLFGLVRQHELSRWLGASDAADAFNAAFKIPNFLQNLFGEGVLSASFIPVYAGLLERGEKEEADRLAGAIGTLLALVTALLVLIGVLATPHLIGLIAPGFAGEKRDITVRLVRILFPGAGLLVLSAWCLGILNSHRHFFLSYAAPVAWNVAIIATLVAFGGRDQGYDLATMAAWGSLVGSGLQLVVQMPSVLGLVRHLRPSLSTSSINVREVVRNFLPVVTGRGVVQLSAYIDVVLASLVSTGAVTVLANAQQLYTLPVSLFGMSVSAAELPTMSRASGSDAEIADYLRHRLGAGLRRIAFFIVPSAAGFLALGDVIAGAIYQSGAFRRTDTVWVWGILAGSAVGLLASTFGRLYASTYYALRDTRTPLRFALVRVLLTTALGYLFALHLPRILGVDPKWGAAGLTASAGIAGWLEFLLLRHSLNRRIGVTGVPAAFLARLWIAAVLGAAAGWGVKLAYGLDHPVILAVLAIGAFGVVYFAVTASLGVEESLAAVARLRRLRGRR
ncbi:MAG: murein biosynthesis integral membrane protein MurJ [Gemmatimonadota bacterium]|nr:murein biosynthesis integral membrane protein MurJ [Gemmatimonadota bacterium]